MRLIAAILLLLFSSPASMESLNSEIDKLFEHYNDQSPGVSVLVFNGDTRIYQKNFGQANLEYGQAISDNTIFNATSLAKQFVAFGVCLLAAEGELSLDDDLEDLLPDFPSYAKPVKIRHLLAHTSGIRDQRGLLNLVGFREDDFISHEDVLHLINNQKAGNFEAGTQFEYNHSNYSLLARVIEIVASEPLNDFLGRKIFTPLGMEHTFFNTSATQVIENCAYGYENLDGVYQKVNLNYENYGPTNLLTTAADLAKWLAHLSKPTLFSPAFMAAFNTISTLDDGNKVIALDLGDDQIYSCKGQFYRQYKGRPFFSHGGSLGGFKSFMGRFPDDGLSIIILSNDKGLNTYAAALSIADIVYDSKVVAATTVPNIRNSEEGEVTNTIREEQYTGRFFNNELNAELRIEIIDEKLSLILGRNRVYPLDLTEIDTYKANSTYPITLTYLRNNQGDISGIEVSSTGVKQMFFHPLGGID